SVSHRGDYPPGREPRHDRANPDRIRQILRHFRRGKGGHLVDVPWRFSRPSGRLPGPARPRSARPRPARSPRRARLIAVAVGSARAAAVPSPPSAGPSARIEAGLAGPGGGPLGRAVAGGALASGTLRRAAGGPAAGRPNIVVLMTDDQDVPSLSAMPNVR